MYWPYHEPLEIVALLLLDKLDRKAIGQMSDHTADAGPDRERHSDRRLHFSRDRDTGRRHVDDKAAVAAAIGEGQRSTANLPG